MVRDPVHLFCFTVQKNVSNDLMLSRRKTNDIVTSLNSFNSFKHCFRCLSKYLYSEVFYLQGG